MQEKKSWQFRDVEVRVIKAIKKYCDEEGITRARYLKEDKRLKPYLKS